MYEELLKALRCCAINDCGECGYNRRDIPNGDYCTDKLIPLAADAIEELQKLTDAQLDIIKQYQAYLTKQQWIPVTERLPEEYVSILCYCSRNGQYGCGDWCKEDNGTIYWSGLNGMIPTHWMPLPEPPKEETE